MKFFILILLFFIGGLLWPSNVVAVSPPEVEQIISYSTDISVHKDGSVGFIEHIVYNFSDFRHGIFRSLPFIKTTDEGKRLKMTFENIRVTDEKNKPYEFTTSYVDDAVLLKIGDPNQTITGRHEYIISYTIQGALTYFPAHDELYWNALGTLWKVPSLAATATISLPLEVESKNIQATCFIGQKGSTLKFCTAFVNGSVVTVTSTRPLSAYEGMTLVVGFPKGIVAELNPTLMVPFFDTREGKIILVLILLFAVFWYVLLPCIVVWKWWTGGRDPKPLLGQAVAWYSPPKTKQGRELTPAETGTLIDEVVDLKDIYGSLIDLSRRGYFTIIETKKDTFELEKKEVENDVKLQPFEKILLSVLFDTKDRVKLRDVKLYDNLTKLNDMIYNSLVADGFFPTNPQGIRTKYVVLTVLSFITFNPILGIVSWIFGMSMPKKTLFGSEQAAVARALKNFLKSQDNHLAFQAKEKFMFEKLLPYAIAFGVEVLWAKRFKDMNLPTPDWYVSSSSGGHFSSVVFANALHAGYGVSFAQSVTYKSSVGYHSGFSSGGGFSGGGGGGGGGGSW